MVMTAAAKSTAAKTTTTHTRTDREVHGYLKHGREQTQRLQSYCRPYVPDPSRVAGLPVRRASKMGHGLHETPQEGNTFRRREPSECEQEDLRVDRQQQVLTFRTLTIIIDTSRSVVPAKRGKVGVEKRGDKRVCAVLNGTSTPTAIAIATASTTSGTAARAPAAATTAAL